MTTIRNEKGFTLIELMVVAVILAIIAAIAVPIYNGYKQEAQTQEAYATLTQWADVCIGKAVKAKETNQTVPQVSTTATPLDGDYFNYSGTGNVAAAVLTATGKAGAVNGKTLKVTVSIDATNYKPTKTWNGDLY
jgi:prepilin-type N-terminal cleavage/methylation domain-containing protein